MLVLMLVLLLAMPVALLHKLSQQQQMGQVLAHSPACPKA
jgi:hypothetical protein